MKNLFLLTDRAVKKNKYLKIININELDLHTYFIDAHKLTREFNKLLLKEYTNIPKYLHLSLIKLSDKDFFEASRIILIINNKFKNKKIVLDTKHNDLLKIMFSIFNYDDSNIEYKNPYSPYNYKRNITYIFYSVILLLNSFFIKLNQNSSIFLMYNDNVSYNIFKPYEKFTIAYPIFGSKIFIKPTNYKVEKYLNKKFISLKAYFNGMKNYFHNLQYIGQSDLPKSIKKIYKNNLIVLEVQSQIILSLEDKFKNLKTVMGMFDADPTIDYITYHFNKNNIRTICIPHGINFKSKVHYISYGTNVYTFWSRDHFKRMEESVISKDLNVEKIITGNIVYTNTLKHIKKSENNTKKILIIGEYFSTDEFYTSPFNKKSSILLFDILKVFSKNKNIEITIRTRLNDGYYELAKNYLSCNIKLSSPNKSMVDDINEHDLIISIFSNALHEALLLEKKVLQVNLLGIENYRSLAENNLVYYADNIEKLRYILDQWYTNSLPTIDFKIHLKEYANNGIFDIKKVKKVINDNL